MLVSKRRVKTVLLTLTPLVLNLSPRVKTYTSLQKVSKVGAFGCFGGSKLFSEGVWTLRVLYKPLLFVDVPTSLAAN